MCEDSLHCFVVTRLKAFSLLFKFYVCCTLIVFINPKKQRVYNTYFYEKNSVIL